MASNHYVQATADGRKTWTKRSVKQGRRPSGLAKPRLIRLHRDDDILLKKKADELGRFFNANEIIRLAVHIYLNSIYTELINT